MEKVAAATNRSLVCQVRQNLKPKGIFYGDNPFMFKITTVLAQLSLSSLVITGLQYFLTPLGESAFFSQMLGGFAIGPFSVGKYSPVIRKFFRIDTLYTTHTIAFFGSMLFLFLVGVKIDLSMVKKSGKKAIVIGLCTFFVPMMINTAIACILMRCVTMDPFLHKSLILVASFQSLSSFYVIACVLADLKILNSELGRLATSSSMISGICSWAWTVIVFTTMQGLRGHKDSLLWMGLCIGCMLILIVYVLRPIMLWMIGQTADGKQIKESYVFTMFVMLLGSSFFGEAIGQHFLFGPMILGVAVPDGPPLGSALVEKLDSYVSAVLLPIFYVVSAADLDLSSFHPRDFGVVMLLSLFSFMGKLMGTMLPSLYCKMPVLDALSLGLIMSTQGITDVLILKHALQLQFIDLKSYTTIIITMVLLTGSITPIVKYLYRPSRRFRSYKRRTIQQAKHEAELRVLACIYHQDNTPSIINLLDVSNPTPEKPICFYVVHLIELTGRASPLLVAHHPTKKNSSHSYHSDHIINAFRLYEQQNNASVAVNHFTAICPFVTMHEDVCALALDKRVSMVIIPFHEQYWTVHGTEESANSIRAVNRNILRKAPCSIGILVDRGTLRSANINPVKTNNKPLQNIGMIFLGGQDDREALAYAIRIAQHPNVSLTVVRFLESFRRNSYNVERELDYDITNEFRMANVGSKRNVYKEEEVKDCVEMVSVIRSMENSYDLILVGRRHSSDSPLLVGLTEWNEFPELGFIGDMLASSDSSCEVSVLVVQQQTFSGKDMMGSPKYLVEDSCAVVDMPRDLVKVWPVS